MSTATADSSTSSSDAEQLATAIGSKWPLSGTPSPLPENLPLETCKLVWKAVRARLTAHDRKPSCRDMHPFVKACWRVAALDLCDCAKWITDDSLQGLACVSSLTSIRLTASKFITDGGVSSFAPKLSSTLHTLDLSWTSLSDAAVSTSGGLTSCQRLTSLNLTGLQGISDQCISSLLLLQNLERLSLACTGISDAALDYLTYYTRYPDAGPTHLGCHNLKWLELSNTNISDTGVGKLIAIKGADGDPYGKVFKSLEYLALSSTNNVTTSQVRSVRTKYGFDTPLPNAPRTLAKNNEVALEAQPWVMRLAPTERALTSPPRSWEQERILQYVSAYTKEMAGSVEVIRRLTAADDGSGPPMSAYEPEAKRARAVA